MATNTHGGAGRSFDDLTELYERLANIRGPGAGYTTYKDRTGEKSASERAQDRIENAVLGPYRFITENWKLLAIIAAAFMVLLARK